MAWIAPVVAAIAGIAGSAMSADAQKKAAAAANAPKGSGAIPAATATSFAPSKSKGLADVLPTPGLSPIPQGQDAASVIRLSDALAKTDFGDEGKPAPVPGSAAAPAQPASTLAPPPTAAVAAPASGGGISDILSNAQTWGSLGSLASNVLKPATPAGVMPQPGQTTYSPTANAAMQRLQALLAARQGQRF